MTDELGRDSVDEGLSGKARQATDWVYTNRSNWVRGLLMLAFFFLLGLVKLVIGLIALFQFGTLLVTGQPNHRLARFGASLAAYTCDLVEYLTCAGDRLPFPFSEWPRPNLPD